MVASFTQLLARKYQGQLDADADEYIRYAVDGAQRMQKLILDLLSYAKLSTKGQSPQSIDAASLCKTAIDQLRQSIQEKNAVVTVDPLPTVLGLWNAAHAVVSESHRQRAEVLQPPAPRGACERHLRRRSLGVLGAGQRHRHRAPVLRTHLSDVQAAAYPRAVLGHRHRTGAVPEDRGATSRPHLGGIAAWPRLQLSIHPSTRGGAQHMITRAIEILLVEDNPGDARLTLEAFKEGKVINNVTVVRDGVEAMAYLRRQQPYSQARHPDIILLDLNLPRKDGREVLAEIKSDEHLKQIPSWCSRPRPPRKTSPAPIAVTPIVTSASRWTWSSSCGVASSIESFWLNFVKLPHGEPRCLTGRSVCCWSRTIPATPGCSPKPSRKHAPSSSKWPIAPASIMRWRFSLKGTRT